MTKMPTDFSVKKKTVKSKPKKTLFVSEPEKSEVQYSVTRYDKLGGQTLTDKYVCSAVSNNGKLSYTALIQHNTLYDNKNPLPRNREYKAVSEKCFTQYLRYLNTGVQGDYEKAVRSYIGTR